MSWRYKVRGAQVLIDVCRGAFRTRGSDQGRGRVVQAPVEDVRSVGVAGWLPMFNLRARKVQVLSRETGHLASNALHPAKGFVPQRCRPSLKSPEARLQRARLARPPPRRGCRPVITDSLPTRPQRPGTSDVRRLRAADVPPQTCNVRTRNRTICSRSPLPFFDALSASAWQAPGGG